VTRRIPLLRALLRAAPWVLLVLWGIGQAARDASWLAGLCFYVPSPVLSVICLVGAILRARGSPRSSALLGLLALAPALAVLLVENRWTSAPPASRAELRLVHWNVMYGRLGWTGIEETCLGIRADAYVFSELPRKADIDAFAARLGPAYRASRFGTMGIVARGEVTLEGWIVQEPGIRVQSLTWLPEEETIAILAANVTSSVFVARDPLLRKLRSFLESKRPDIVVGDLNAPRRSRALSPLPPGFRHAYEAAGSGWSYTWPVPIPVYAIDQCIVGERVDPVRYELGSTRWSDHRYQVLDLSRRS
jgi:hypothetical protein